MKRLSGLALALAATLALVGAFPLRAAMSPQLVRLDPSFGIGGRFTVDVGGPNREDETFSSILQPDGKVVIAGKAYNRNTGNFDFAIIRYTANGALDSSFGWGGIVLTDFYGGHDEALAIALQPDGKLVAAGLAGKPGPEPPDTCEFNCLTVTTDFALARYNPNGSLDTTFGRNGRVTTDFFGGQDMAVALVVQPDGKIVAGGVAYRTPTTSEFALARYDPNGGLDATFGWLGRVTTRFAGGEDAIYRLALQPDGDVLASGTARSPANGFDFALARYHPNGSLDTNFGWAGRVMTDFFGSNDVIHASLLQPNGQLVVGGLTYNPGTGNYDYALARYNPNGSLDATFGAPATPGRVTTDFDGSYDQVMELLLQPDGKILAAGEEVNPATSFNFALARYQVNGTLDTTFGNNGRVSTDWFGGPDGIHAAVLQPDGKVWAAGDVFNPATSGKDFASARYLIADPSYIAGVVSGLPGSAFAPIAGVQATILSSLAQVDAQLRAGQLSAAVMALQALRTHVDGCPPAADADDWITACAPQQQVRGLIDQVIVKLSGP